MAPKRSRDFATQEETQQVVAERVRWSKEEKKAKKRLERLRFEPTKFASRDLFERLGLLEDFDKLLKDMGLASLSRIDCPTYPEATLNFLSTLDFSYEDPSIQTPSKGHLTFKIRRQAYHLSIPELCQAYGLNAAAKLVEFPPLKSANFLWDLISDDDYKANTAKIKKVWNPVLQYALKLLANTFSGRSVALTITKNELCFLFLGVKTVLCDRAENDEPIEDELGDDVNYDCILASSLVKYKAWALRCKASSALIGGFLTPMFIQAAVPLVEFEPCAERAYMDETYMRNTDSLGTTPASGFFAYLFYDHNYTKKVCILPNTDETYLQSIGTIEFLPSDEKCFTPLGTAAAPPQLTRSPSESPPTDAKIPPSCDLPKLDYEPRIKAKKFLASVVEIQRKVNKWQGKMIKKLAKKIKALHGSSFEVSSSDEVDHLELRRRSTGGVEIREHQESNQAGRFSLHEGTSIGKDKEILHDTPRKSRRTRATSSSSHV